MHLENSVVAAFPDHLAAEGAVKALADSGFAMKQLSVLGRGYHTEEKVVGFYNAGDRVRFWGALWGVFFGGLFVVTPIAGPAVALGNLGALALATIENAVLVGGWFVVAGEAQIGTVVAFIAGLAKVNDPRGDLVDWYRELTATATKYRLAVAAARALDAAAG